MTPKAATLTPREIVQRSKSSFVASFALLGPARRRGLDAIYAFCRAVDDAADEPREASEARAQLAFWRCELDAIAGGVPATPTGIALQETVRRFGLDVAHLRAVIDGVTMDVEPEGFATFAELDAYCAKVASAVGLACLPVFGAHGPAAERYAHELGLALQLTNILRDLVPDAREGRVYVPRDVLAGHGIDPDWLRGDADAAAYVTGGPVDRMVAELVAVARTRFVRSLEVRPRDQRRALLPAEVMAAVYRELLARVARRGGRLDGARPRVPRGRKLALLVRTWWQGGRRARDA